ncbi:RE1 [Symbiodinium sp. CCMP2592]|nr:RE1 [Symbiodinium sp. CCMP2592]
MEIASGPDSLLSRQIQELAGSTEAATQCSVYNGCELTNDSGVRLILQRLELERPAHVWIRPPSGPYSPLQHNNAQSPEQKQELQVKREQAMREQDLRPDSEREASFAVDCCEVEGFADQAIQKQDFSHDTCEQLLDLLPCRLHEGHRGMLDAQSQQYLIFGAYSHGNHYGLTKRSQKYPKMIKYLLSYMRHWSPEPLQATSLVVNFNGKCPLHKDQHNDASYPNAVIGLGTYQGGELWVARESPTEGETGDLYDIYRTVQRFSPKVWHGPQAWTGRRIVVGTYVTRGHRQLSEDQPKKLQGLGFQVPRDSGSGDHQAYAALPPKLHTISTDIGHWTHPQTGEIVQFMLIIDEGSRFRTARILSRGSKKQPNPSTCIHYLREGWAQYFGMPRALRLDAAGAFVSQQLVEFCDQEGIFLDNIPADGHWQIGVCEQAIQGVKEVMDKICSTQDQVASETALAHAITSFNAREQVRGFSPIQHVFGRSPDITGRLLQTAGSIPDELVIESATEELEASARLRAEAEKAHAEWHAAQQIARAKNSRARPRASYQAGDLIYFWRTQESGQGRRSPGTKHGRFLGPARVLAVESKRDEDGSHRAGSTVWCVRGRNLIKCCVEQLRDASEREQLLESLAAPHGHDPTPWTFTRVAEEIGGNQFQDVSQEVPTAMEWERAQDVLQEAPPPRFRFRGKRAQPEPAEVLTDADPPEPASGSRGPVARTSTPMATWTDAVEERWYQKVPETSWYAQDSAFWTDQTAAVEVSIDMPNSKQGWTKANRCLKSYFVGALKRRAAEVSERHLNPEELQRFRDAKQVEVNNFIASNAFESLPEHLAPSREQAVNMRWLLTWKVKEDGLHVSYFCKQPPIAHGESSRATSQELFKQGREYPDDLFCIPCPEICEAMQIPVGSITKLRRACYGLVDAPLEWYRTISEYFAELGLVRLWSDACMWAWRVNGQLRGLITGHVDDFLFAGADDDPEWQAILQKIKERFKWGDWEQDDFIQCGVRIQQTSQGFQLSQARYVEDIPEIPLNHSRRKDRNQPTTAWEKTKLRALLGAVSWHAQQVAPHFAAEVSLLLSDVNESTVATLLQANQLLQSAKARKGHQMLIHAFNLEVELGCYAWVDAANENRRDGGSTQGIFIGLAPASLLKGEVGQVSPISWQSHKIDRVCRSPGAAEVQAAVNGEDQLYYVRFQWSEMLHGCVHTKDPDSAVTKVLGCVITDSRNVYDKLQTEVLSIKGAEKKANIELLSIKEAQAKTQVIIRWVHSEAQLGNSLTKHNANKELELFYRMHHCWRIVEDSQMRSARKRRTEGLDTLQGDGADEVFLLM